ncbi:hypothetical protein [Opitutus sp. ER46]|uniref:hypothetical protein n=1 Tax=Opitutus sp. ER46 TaxID=2161864 RepID=UPI000D2FC33B|nr:hypothetical protein [Opitutus sp. ER46]PTX95600.1 hypothetical protein DB354_09290 [Opitutus sp. ER46]
MHLLRLLLLLGAACAASSALTAAPFRLFEIGVTRFLRDDSGQGHFQSGRLAANGTLTIDSDNPSPLIAVPASALGKIVVFTEAWFAYGQLGAEARANFRLAGGGTPIEVGNLLYYEVEPDPQAQLATGDVVNLSSRGAVAPGLTPSLIGGFVITGQPRRVLIRAVGPTLAQLNVPNPLADPVLAVFRGQTKLFENDNWGTQPEADAIAQIGGQLGAFALPRTSKDAVLLLTLPPGEYTATVATPSPTAGGEALLEIYVVP